VDFVVLRLWYGKVQAEDTWTLLTKRERNKRKDPCSFARAGLSGYLCKLCTMCVNLSMLGVVSTPPQQLLQCMSGGMVSAASRAS
jgi:hypothetical protein